MISERYKYDGKQTINLNHIQIAIKDVVESKIRNGIYKFEEISCLCGSNEYEVLSEKDKFGLSNNIVICKECGLVRANPRMTQESFNEFYDNDYRKLYLGEEEPSSKFFQHEFECGKDIYSYIEKNVEIEDRNVLEIGCGAGGILKVFKDRGWKENGIDLDSRYVSFGKKLGLNLKNCNSRELANGSQKYDLIILNHVLEHFLDIKAEMKIISKLLSANGHLYIFVPGLKNLKELSGGDFLANIQNAHTYYFTYNTLKQIMMMYGFKMVSGNEKIEALFIRDDKKSKMEINNYYCDIKTTLLSLEMEIENNKKRIKEYRENLFDVVLKKVRKYKRESVLIYGIGNHTNLLLAYLENYKDKIAGLLDKDSNNIGKKFYGFEVKNINEVGLKTSAIIISSDVYQNQIYERIKKMELHGIEIIKIYSCEDIKELCKN